LRSSPLSCNLLYKERTIVDSIHAEGELRHIAEFIVSSVDSTKRPAFTCLLIIVFGMCAAHLGIIEAAIIGVLFIGSLIFIRDTKKDRVLILALFALGMFMDRSTEMMKPPRDLPLPPTISTFGIIQQPIRRHDTYTSTDLCVLDPEGNSTSFRFRTVFPDSLCEIQEGQQYRIHGSVIPLQFPRNPGATDWDGVLQSRGCLARVFIDSCSAKQPAVLSSDIPLRSRIRSHLNGILRDAVGVPEGILAGAMLLGVREDISQDVMASFRNAGIVHVLAVSGLHVGIIVGVLLLAGTVCFPGYRVPAIFSLGGLLIYVIIVGPYASILRSSVMAAAILLGVTIGRRSDPLNSLSVAGLILLISHPEWLWNPGFQLSFGATMGILFFTPALVSVCKTRKAPFSWLVAAVAASLGAQLGIFPIVMYHFRQWPLYGLIANIPAVLLMTVLIWASILLVVFTPIWGIAAGVFSATAQWAARGLFRVAEGVSNLPQAVVSWGTTGSWILACVWALGFVMITAPKRSRPFACLVTILILLDVWLLWGMLDPWFQPKDRIISLHVDRGNAIVLESKSGDMLFIDPGSSQTRKNALAAVSDYKRFRNQNAPVDIGVTSCSYTRAGTIPLLREDGHIRRLFTPAECVPDTACIPIQHDWKNMIKFHDFRLEVFNGNGRSVDGVLIESPSGLRFLIVGEWGWLADTRLAGESSVGGIDILYTGPGRDHGPSHLLLRKVRPGIVIAGGTGSLESGAHDRIAKMGIELFETSFGAVIIEDSGSHATIRQIKRS